MGFSRLRRDVGLSASANSLKLLFSWPRVSGAEKEVGSRLRESPEGAKTRLRGLFGEPRDLERGRVTGFDLVERTESLMFGLLTKGLPAIPCWGAEKEVGEEGPARAAGVAGIGVEAGCSRCADLDGAAGVGVGEGETAPESRNFDGDLESDLRSDRTAELTSWWTCVGEGRVSAPPQSLVNDITGPWCVPRCLFCSYPQELGPQFQHSFIFKNPHKKI